MRLLAKQLPTFAPALVAVVVAGIANGIPLGPTGFISVPLTSVRRVGESDLHPALVHQQHVNRGLTRYALLSGREEPSHSDLLSQMTDRLSSLPHSVQKRYNQIGLEEVIEQLSTQSLHSNTPSQPSVSDADIFLGGRKGFSPYVLDIATKHAVTPARRPTFDNSVGLDIQANDLGYMATFQMGTPPKDFRLLIDSGSGDLWVGGENCTANGGGDCGKHNFLGPSSSSSCRQTDLIWAIRYGSGAVIGRLVHDHISIAGLTLESYTFGVATKETIQFTPDRIPFDGIAGTARSSLSRQHTTPFVEALQRAGKIREAIASYKISRVDDRKNDGELTLGGMNPARYKAETLVTVPNLSIIGFWEVPVETVVVDGHACTWTETKSAILDTGSTLLLAPKQDVADIHAKIPGSRYDGRTWTIPCNITTVVKLKIGGREFPIDPRDLTFVPVDLRYLRGYCMSSITEVSLGGRYQRHWLVGDVFLKNVYLSTNVGTNQISIAELAD